MSKKLFGKFFIFLLVVGLLFAVAPTRQAQAAVKVNNEAELLTALSGTEITIELGADIALTNTVYVSRAVTIDGKGKTITGATGVHGIIVNANNVTIKDLTITASGKTNLQFYVVTGGVVNNVVLSNAGNAGMIVNGSSVTISNVTTTNNAWGGINVDKGIGVTQDPLLTVSTVTTHTSPTAGITPAIWVDTGNAAWVSAGTLYTVVPGTPLAFFDVAEYLAVYGNVWVCPNGSCGHPGVEFSTIRAGIDAVAPGGTINVAAGEYPQTTKINITKAMTIIGPTTGVAKISNLGGGTTADLNTVFNISTSNVTLENLTITLESQPLAHQALVNVEDVPGGVTKINLTNNKLFVQQQPGAMSAWWGYAVWYGRYVTDSHVVGNTIYNTRGGFIAHYNCQVEIKDNLIYNTKGGIQNYTHSATDAANRVISNNSWETVHNEWDIVWNSGGGPYDLDENALVLGISQSNNDAYVVSQMPTAYTTPPQLIYGNRSHVFVNAVTGTETIGNSNGNINLPYKKIQDAIDAVVPGGKVIVAAGTYAEDLEIGKSVTLLGPNAAISPNTGTRVAEAIIAPANETGVADPAVLITASNISVTMKGLTFDMVNTTDDNDRFVESINKTGVTMDVQNNRFLNAPGCINGNWYITGLTNPFTLILKDNFFYGSKVSNGISLWGDAHTVDIQNNVWKDNGGWTLNFNHVTGTIANNQILDTEENGANWYDEQAGFLFASENNLTLTGNTFDGLPNPSIRLYDSFKGNLTATGNIFKNTEDPTTGVIRISDGATLSGVHFDKNHFLNNPIVAQNLGTGTETLDVTPNWWGQATGPVAGQILGTTQYLPYCLNQECTEFSQASLSFSPVTVDGTCGPQVLDVMVADAVDITAYSLEITFDQTKVRIDSVVNGSFLQSTQGTVTLPPGNDLGNSTGKLIFGAYLTATTPGDPGPVSGSGSLIRITYTPLLGSTTFTVDATESMLVNWPDALPVPFSVTGPATTTVTNGLVTNTTMSPNVTYCDLPSAVTAATSGDTLRVDANFVNNVSITINKALTLNTNGKTITRNVELTPNNSFVVVPGGDLTINGGGTITATSGNAIRIEGNETTQARVKLESGTIYAPNASVAVIGNRDATNHTPVFKSLFEMTGGNTNETVLLLGNGAEANISGGTLIGWAPIMGNGTVNTTTNNGGTKITISGDAAITGTDVAIYHPQDGELIINGGTITGTNGVEMKAGDLKITGGTINATGPFAAPTATGNGSTDTGDAILIFNRNGYTGDLTVDISGGAFTSAHGYALREVTLSGETSRTTSIKVTGGSFTGGVGTGDAGAAVSFTTVAPAVLQLTDGQYNTDPGLPVADYVFTPYDTYFVSPWFMIDPVDITDASLDGPFTAGLPGTVTLTVADTDHTGPFEVVFTYPEGTSITYGGTTVVCTAAGCPAIVVTLADSGSTTLSFAVTLPGVGPYAVGAALNHNAGVADIRLLDSVTATGVVASGNFTVTGAFSMQGNATRAGIPVTFTWGSTYATYAPVATSTAAAGTNLSLMLNYGGPYTITTNQPRYLNLYADVSFNKLITVSGNYTLPELRLRGGNAVWTDNVINTADAGRVGSDWGGSGSTDLTINHGDVNFDNKVNIQDLALVGGNYDLTSAAAYATWLP